LAELETAHRFAKVAIWTLRVDLYGQIEPLFGVCVLHGEVVAATDIVDAAVVSVVNFDTREVVV